MTRQTPKKILDQMREKGNILRRNEIKDILSRNNIQISIKEDELSSFLNTKVKSQSLKFPHRRFEVFLIGDTKDYKSLEIALSVNEKAYLSHYSALQIHKIITDDDNDKSIYVNVEQTKKEKEALIDQNQEEIDSALNKPVRLSNNYIDLNNQRIFLLNGQYTGNLGVDLNDRFPVTDIERTLIDIAVRPQYAGGIKEVLKVYEASKHLICLEKLVSYLEKINFFYPYHQSIGFLLETAGYRKKDLDLLKKCPIKRKFYLVHNMDEKDYSSNWNLFFPSDLKQNN